MTALELLQSGQPFKALPLLAKKAKKEPTLPNLLALGAAQRACCQFDAARETLVACVALTSGKVAEVWNNIAQLHTDLGQFHEAPELFRRALQVAQSTPIPDASMQQILLGMAYSLMRLGQFEYTWEAFEAGRLGVSWGALPMTKVWQGEPNSRVLIVCEGGFGDGFLFSRWIPQVVQSSAKVGIVVWNKLLDFCDWKRFGVHEVLPMLGSIQAANWDYTISMMSLPGIFKMRSFADVPPDLMHEAFLETVPTSQRGPRIKNHEPMRIGFCWRAEENGSARKIRSLDDVTAGAVGKELASAGEVFSLCPAGKSLHRHDQFKPVPRVFQDENRMMTWNATAGYIRSMDLVVSVDTAVFHLAGLLGVPTLLLLPVRSDWKYQIDMVADPWYGPHVTYYREKRPEGWTIEAIREAVRLKLGSLSEVPESKSS